MERRWRGKDRLISGEPLFEVKIGVCKTPLILCDAFIGLVFFKFPSNSFELKSIFQKVFQNILGAWKKTHFFFKIYIENLHYHMYFVQLFIRLDCNSKHYFCRSFLLNGNRKFRFFLLDGNQKSFLFDGKALF